MLVSRVSKGDCFLEAILVAVGILPDMCTDMQSDEHTGIWATESVPVINQLRQQMSSVIVSIQKAGTEAWGEQAIDILFGDIEHNKARWIKIVSQEQRYNPWQPGTWGGDIELAVEVWILQVNLYVLTRLDERQPPPERWVRTFHFDGSTTPLLYLTGNMPPLVNTLSHDVLPQIADFVTVELHHLAEKQPCFFEILGFFVRDFDVLNQRLDVVITKDELQAQGGSTTTRPSVLVLHNVNHFDVMLRWDT